MCYLNVTCFSAGQRYRSMKLQKVLSLLLSCCLVAGISACGNQTDLLSDNSTDSDVKEFTSFFAQKLPEYDQNNEIKNTITRKLGVKCDEVMLRDGENLDDIVSKMISSEEYPDFIYAEKQHPEFLEAGAYIPIDEYWDECENLKRMYSDECWNRLREDDGHIYIIPIFTSNYMYDTNTVHDSEAFWIQVKVLKWAGYPKITTLDEYFDVIERYLAANPCDEEDGEPNIGYEILTDGYYYFCLENPPQFLDGYPNDGCCIVDPKTLTAMDYNITDTAKRWFKKLNEEYHKGIIDPESFVLTKDQYFDKISSGHVLGMVDQRWNFGVAADKLIDEDQYVPIGVVIDKGIEEHYHSEVAIDVSQGLGITKSCTDIKGAIKFIDSLLSPEIHTLRFWGIEGTNYEKNSDGVFYLTESQRELQGNTGIMLSYAYPLFPYFSGMDQDGINAFSPIYQPSEFYEKLSDTMKECLSAYGAHTYVELLNKSEKNPAWFPMWSYSNTFTTDTDYGRVWNDIDSIKHQYLPKVVMSDDFESSWSEYMDVYKSQSNSKILFDELTAEVRRRAGK